MRKKLWHFKAAKNEKREEEREKMQKERERNEKFRNIGRGGKSETKSQF